MGAYIINIPSAVDRIIYVVVESDGKTEIATRSVSSLQPYTEPDMEQVRKEAYDKGYDDAKGGYENGFENGMIVAWEAARKIIHMPEGDLLNIFTECYSAVCTALQVLLKYDASEAIEKLKAYEQEQNEIHVGDEVITASGKAVVLGVGPVHFEYVNADGSNGFAKVKNAEKTGRHFPEIAEVLAKMKES